MSGLEQFYGASCGLVEADVLAGHAASLAVAEGSCTDFCRLLQNDSACIESAVGCRLCAVECVANLSIAGCGHVNENLAPLIVAVYVDSHVVEMLGVVISETVIQVSELCQTVGEAVVVLQCGLAPLHLAERCQSGQSHILHLLESGHILCPDVCLYADDVACLVSCKLFGHRLVRIDGLKGQVTTDGKRLVGLVERLIIVEVEIAVRCHHHVVMLLCCGNASRFATP